VKAEEPLETEFRFVGEKGAKNWVLAHAAPMRDAEKNVVGYAGSITNIDARKRAEEVALEQETRFRDLADQAPIMIGVTDAEGHIVFLNKTWLDFRGRTLEEEEGWSWAAELHPDDRDRTCTEMEECIGQNAPYSIEYRIKDKEGRYHWMLDTAIPRVNAAGDRLGYIGTAIVIDGQKRLESRLREEVADKEMLLREIHHRVKNNLQIISSLIHFQSLEVQNSDTAKAFYELEQRLVAMSVIHDKLYQAGRFSAVDFSDYSKSLVEALVSSMFEADRLHFDISTEPISLPLPTALPAGMVLCELLTNVAKHAYSHDQTGDCRVALQVKGTDVIVEVADDGVGLPKGFNPSNDGGFGWELIRGLVGQLEGTIEVLDQPGTTVRFQFPADIEAHEAKLQEAEASTRDADMDLPPDHYAMSTNAPRVYLVEDEAPIALQIKTSLREAGYIVSGHSTRGATALRQISELMPDVVLMDIKLADGISGQHVARQVQKEQSTPIVFISAYKQTNDEVEIPNTIHIQKPFDPKKLICAIEEVLDSRTDSI
jgi:PAS domain S-box-containing protein